MSPIGTVLMDLRMLPQILYVHPDKEFHRERFYRFEKRSCPQISVISSPELSSTLSFCPLAAVVHSVFLSTRASVDIARR